jgi:DNA-directed RNA polymerase specialized sigma subunit
VTRYNARYTFDGRGWIVQFEKPDISTFGRSLTSAKAHARSLLAVWLEVDDLSAAGAAIVDRVELPRSAEVDVKVLVRQRARAEALRRDLARGTRSAAKALRAAGLSTRDVGEILGISGARVSRLDQEAR